MNHLTGNRERAVFTLDRVRLVAMGYGGSIQDAASVVGGPATRASTTSSRKTGYCSTSSTCRRRSGRRTSGVRPSSSSQVLCTGRAKRGVFITTSTFSKDARDYVAHIDPRIVLIDGKELAALMIDNNVGVTSERVYELKRTDSDFFADE